MLYANLKKMCMFLVKIERTAIEYFWNEHILVK